MESNSWKYAENSFEARTRKSRAKMNTIVLDHDAKLTAAANEAGADPRLATLLADWTPEKNAWTEAYRRWKNTKATYGGGTIGFENLLRALQIKPGPEHDSKIENWDSRIRPVAPRGSATYTTLLPRGRAPFSEGSRDDIVEEVRNLGTRLAAQGNETLTAIGRDVTDFYNQLDRARSRQQGLEGDTDLDASEIEAARKRIAIVLYGDVGMLMQIYRETPERISAFFDLDTLRQAAGSGAAEPAPPPAAPVP